MIPASIEEVVGERQISVLLHFTRSINLPSIMQNGILPRDRFANSAIKAEINDELRLDGRLDGISLSIGFPNSKMLWKLRQENPGVNWVIIGIDRSILWELPCAFCKHNAADARISSKPLETLQSPAALREIYSYIEGFDRVADKLKAFDPTDVQAEVLVFDRIPPEKFVGAVFQRTAIRDQYSALFGDKKLLVHGDRGFFSDRGYHRRSTG
jgi:hypothetical protein